MVLKCRIEDFRHTGPGQSMIRGQRPSRSLLLSQKPSNVCWRCFIHRGQRSVSTRSSKSLQQRQESSVDSSQTRPSLGKDKATGAHTSDEYSTANDDSRRADSLGRVGRNTSSRPFSTSSRTKATAQSALASPSEGQEEGLLFPKLKGHSKVRQHLRVWQIQKEQEDAQHELEESQAERTITSFRKLQLLREEHDALQPSKVNEEDSDTLDPAVEETDVTVDRNMRCGDLVEIGGSKALLAIFIRRLGRQLQFYTIKGKWAHASSEKHYFVVSGFTTREEVAPIIPYLPSAEVPEERTNNQYGFDSSVPREVGSNITAKLIQFERAADQVYRNNAEVLDKAWVSLAQERHFFHDFLPHITQKLLSLPSDANIPYSTQYAVHRALMAHELGLMPIHQATSRLSGMWLIQPVRDVDVAKQIRQWLRIYNEALIADIDANRNVRGGETRKSVEQTVIFGFVKRTREILRRSRKYRKLLDSEAEIGPSSIQVAPEQTRFLGEIAFRNTTQGERHITDKIILRFMEAWSAQWFIKQGTSPDALGPMILRATGMYDGYVLDKRCGFLFLKEMGFFTPWQNLMASSVQLALPGHNLDPEMDAAQKRAAESLDGWQSVDQMSGLRKDWGDLEVFCIDDISTKEVDDGISIESIEGDDSHHWLHIHIANPTAFISPEHPIALYADQLTESIYLPERVFHMMEPSFGPKHFSLANNRPALTFSAKLNSDGVIKDYKITPGYIRNVTYLTPHTLQCTLEPESLQASFRPSLVVGHNTPHVPSAPSLKTMTETLSDVQIDKLRKIRAIGLAASRERIARGGLIPFNAWPSCVVSYIDAQLPFRQTVRKVDGDPTISATILGVDRNASFPYRTFSVASEDTVSSSMVVACEVAARWCQERKIPIIFRSTLQDPEMPSLTEFKEKILDPETEKYGQATWRSTRDYSSLLGRGVITTEARRHNSIGVEAYTKATSPLRRYCDMLTHWQIEAAIRHEAKTGVSFAESRDLSCLPFSCAELEGKLQRLSDRERRITKANRVSKVHWLVQLLSRAYNFKEIELPETWTIWVQTLEPGLGGLYWRCELLELGLQVGIGASMERTKGFKSGDYWEAKITCVNTFLLKVDVEPLSLISTEAERVAGEMERKRAAANE